MDLLQRVLGLGLEPKELSVLQITIRAAIVFFTAVVMFRLADKRFLSRMSAFDATLGFILGSMLARAINGSAPFFETLGVGFVLVFLHKLLAVMTFRWERFGNLIKGREEQLIDHGKVIREKMRANHIADKDLLEELRQEGSVVGPEEVKKAYLERSGKVSVVPKESK